MQRYIAFIGVVAGLLTGVALVGYAKETPDQEKIIDVQALSEAMAKATAPLGERMRASNLKQRFGDVKVLLKQEDVNKEKLVEALEALQAEMDAFTQNWEEVVAPLWEGQEAIADTIENLRMMVARGAGGEPSDQDKEKLVQYDRRLKNLAQVIQSEADPERKKRLKILFKNVLTLRELVSRASHYNLGPARQALYVKMIGALSNLEAALTAATFKIEAAREMLEGESQFVGQYILVMKGIIEAESLAEMLKTMKGDGNGIPALAADMDALSSEIVDFTELMDQYSEKVADRILTDSEEVTEQLADDSALEAVNVDEEIERYVNLDSEEQAETLVDEEGSDR